MEQLTISRTDAPIGGCVQVPASKSYMHRHILAAALAAGESVISNVSYSNDIDATLLCAAAMGARVRKMADSVAVGGVQTANCFPTLDCGESASTLRFLIPVAAVLCGGGRFVGSETLLKRPLEPYFHIFEQNGMDYEYFPGKYLEVRGGLHQKTYHVDGSVSSQFVTGLLYALPLLTFDTEIVIDGVLESKPYIDITLDTLRQAGIDVENEQYQLFRVRGGQAFAACNVTAQGDYSQAAFFIAAGLAAGEVRLQNLARHTTQGDAVIVSLAKAMGGDVQWKRDDLVVKPSKLRALGVIDAHDFPDLVPVLSLICTQCEGDTVIKNIGRLKIKECDRLAATQELLSRLGAQVTAGDDSLHISGGARLTGGEVDSYNDHRMAMTAAIAALVSENPVTIERPMSINKSYPHFYEDLKRLGGVRCE